MKKGKCVKLNLYSPIKTTYGTVDYKNLKSIYINIQSWVTPKRDSENWRRVVNLLAKDIKCSVNESINRQIFKEDIIVDLDLRVSGISQGKKSFFNLEITIFTIDSIEFRLPEIKESVKKIIKTIYRNDIIQNRDFDFLSSKKEFEVKL